MMRATTTLRSRLSRGLNASPACTSASLAAAPTSFIVPPAAGLMDLQAFADPLFWKPRPAVVPQFWTGEQALADSEFTLDCTYVDMTPKPDSKTAPYATIGVAQRARQVFEEHGIVRLKNTGLGDDVARMSEWVRWISPEVMDYKGGANMRSAIYEDAPNVFDTGAPKEAWLHYHHEMAYLPFSPTTLGFVCKEATPDKGDTYFSKNDDVTAALLRTEVGQKLKERGICYIRCLTDRDAVEADDNEFADDRRVYNHWQTSFLTDSMEEAEAAANAKQLKVEWAGKRSRYMKTKFYTSAFEYCPAIDKNTLFASVADDSVWFDTWPGVLELPRMTNYMDASEDDRPLKITYGDDSEMSPDELRTFMDVYDQFGVRVGWEKGDVVVFCNYRWAHGRPEYTLEEGEKREIAVILGGMFERKGHLPGKW